MIAMMESISNKASAVLFVSAVALLPMACLCSDATKLEAKSPAGKHVAIHVERNCGATADYSTHVVVRRVSVFDGNENTVLVIKGQPRIEFEWRNESELVVKHSAGEIFQTKDTSDGVRIEFKLIR